MTAVMQTGGAQPPVVTKPDGKYNLTKFPLVQTESTDLNTLPFVLKFPGSNGHLYYLTAEGTEETFIRSNENINDAIGNYPFEVMGRNGERQTGGYYDALIQISKQSLSKVANNETYTKNITTLLNNNLATDGVENLGKFNDYAKGFGTLKENSETKKIEFTHNEEFLFADAEKALAEISTVTNNNGEYTFTFKEAANFITEDNEYYTLKNGNKLTAKKIGDVYISYPTIENSNNAQYDATVKMNEIVPEAKIVFSATASENVKATAGLTVNVTKSADTYTVKVTNETGAEIKDAKVQVVIGTSGIVAKTVSLGNVPAKQQ